MGARYVTEAANLDGGEGWSRVRDGIGVRVGSPLLEHDDPDVTNPEQLLALAWATCLGATARVFVTDERRTTVRVEVELHDADPGPGLEFHVTAFLSLEDAGPGEAERLLASAHARCPVSKLLSASSTVRTTTEPFTTP